METLYFVPFQCTSIDFDACKLSVLCMCHLMWKWGPNDSFYSNLFSFLIGWQNPIWLCIWNQCNRMFRNVLFVKFNEYDRCLIWLCGKCPGVLSPSHDPAVQLCSGIFLTVSTDLKLSLVGQFSIVVFISSSIWDKTLIQKTYLLCLI